MKSKLKNTFKAFMAVLLIAALNGCYTTTHIVGSGGNYDGKKIANYDAKKKKWFLLGGLVPLDDVSAHEIKGDAVNYTSRETHSFGDLVIGGATLGIVAPKTIRISKGD